jgi:hypothetical protein
MKSKILLQIEENDICSDCAKDNYIKMLTLGVPFIMSVTSSWLSEGCFLCDVELFQFAHTFSLFLSDLVDSFGSLSFFLSVMTAVFFTNV